MSSIKTPELIIASDALNNLIKQADRGIADVPQGRIVIGASNGMCRVIKTDLERRIAAPKLAAIEATAAERRAQLAA